jgi:hypothetical protein
MWVPFLIQAHKSWRGYCGMEVEKRHRQECAKHYVRTVSSSVISFDRHEFGVRFFKSTTVQGGGLLAAFESERRLRWD